MTPHPSFLPVVDEEQRQLSRGTRDLLLYLTDLLRHGYSGTVTLDCREGGIRELHLGCSLRPPDLEKR